MGSQRATHLPQPITTDAMSGIFESYREALAQLTPENLMTELGRVNALIEAQSSSLLTSQLWQASHSAIDRLDQASEPSSMSPFGPGPERPTSDQPRQTGPSAAVPLLMGSGRLGPRLAAKIVVSSTRAQSRRR